MWIRRVLFFGLVARSFAIRAGGGNNDSDDETEKTAALALHLEQLGAGEPHHVCVTGNRAGEAIDSYVLEGTGESRKHVQLPSRISKVACSLQEVQVGHTLFTIAESLPDKCLPRWRTHSQSCDVLFHAHAGGDCSALSKFRLVHDRCGVDLVVMSDTKELSSCFTEDMARHEFRHPGSNCADSAVWLDSKETNIAEGVTAALKNAMARNAFDIRKRVSYIQTKLPKEDVSLRSRLDDNEDAKVVNVHDSLLRASQGIAMRKGEAFMQVLDAIKMQNSATSGARLNPILTPPPSGFIKAGFGGDEAPSKVFPTAVGRAKYHMAMLDTSHPELFFGDRAINSQIRGVLKLSYPMQRGIIKNWEDMEKIWEHTLNIELKKNPGEQPVMLTEAPGNPKKDRETTTEIFFEKFQVQEFYLALQPVLSMYSSGRTTGLVLDIGDGVTHASPIYEGYALPHATRRLNLAGSALTEYMTRLLLERSTFIPATSAEREIARDIKEKTGYVAADFEAEKSRASKEVEMKYDMPDGTVLKIGDERFRCPEALFKPSLAGVEEPGIHEIVSQAIQACDTDIQQELWKHIVLVGGSSMFKGLPNRLEEELKHGAPEKALVKVSAIQDVGKIQTWVGGSILSTLGSFKDNWITGTDYGSDGAGIVHKKCVV